jgi:hypothetical protein
LTKILYYVIITNGMAFVVKWLTHRFVVPTFAGSIPVRRPIKKILLILLLVK